MTVALFLLKKLISFFFYPLSIIAVLMICGLILLWMTRKKNLGKIFLTLGTALLLLTGNAFLTDWSVASFENRYPPLLDLKDIHNPQNIKWIVVLGGGYMPDPHRPFSSQINSPSLIRLLEGVSLHRKLPGSKLILSGGSTFQDTPEGEMLAKAALLMGVSENDIVRESKSLDTSDQAKFISSIVGRNQFILVTSAIHMPRSIALFHKFGMNPIAAPTNFISTEQSHISIESFFPTPGSLGKAQVAIHEYIGLLWVSLK